VNGAQGLRGLGDVNACLGEKLGQPMPMANGNRAVEVVTTIGGGNDRD